MAVSIFHFLTAAIKFSRYSSNEIGLLFFISGASSFSVIHGYVDFTVKPSKKIIGFVVVVFFISKNGCAIYCRKERYLQNFTPAYMKGWTYVRTYSVRTIFSKPKFLGCRVYQIFLPIIIIMKNVEVTYNVPLFFEQRIIKTLGMKYILFLFLLHKPFNLKKEKMT